MESKWIARPYKYADGVAWNDFRYEIFFRVEDEWVSVGGVMQLKGRVEAIAFLCRHTSQRYIRSPQHVEREVAGRYVMGDNIEEALRTLKWKYPEPVQLLQDDYEMRAASF